MAFTPNFKKLGSLLGNEVCGEAVLLDMHVEMETWSAAAVVAPVAGGEALGEGIVLCA